MIRSIQNDSSVIRQNQGTINVSAGHMIKFTKENASLQNDIYIDFRMTSTNGKSDGNLNFSFIVYGVKGFQNDVLTEVNFGNEKFNKTTGTLEILTKVLFREELKIPESKMVTIQSPINMPKTNLRFEMYQKVLL